MRKKILLYMAAAIGAVVSCAPQLDNSDFIPVYGEDGFGSGSGGTGSFAGQETVADNQVKVISFNVRTSAANDGDNAWNLRCKGIGPMLTKENPTVFGLQEARLDQVNYISGQMTGYGHYGVGRDDGNEEGEIMAIFWKTDAVAIGKYGTFWLSATPDTPSKGWDAKYKRTVTWAEFTLVATGQKFFYVNTHIDNEGVLAKQQSIVLIKEKLGELNPKGYPAIVTADYNAALSNTMFDAWTGYLYDARSTATITDSRETYHGYGSSSSKIDHIFYNGFEAVRYRTVTDAYEGVRYLSDHYPIYAVLEFKAEDDGGAPEEPDVPENPVQQEEPFYYVFSLYGTAGSGDIPKYVSAVQGSYDASTWFFDNTYTELDGSGNTLYCRGTARPEKNFDSKTENGAKVYGDLRVTDYYSNNYGVDNIPVKSFVSPESVTSGNPGETFYKLKLTLGQELPSAVRMTFGIQAGNGAIADWNVSGSMDDASWKVLSTFTLDGSSYLIYNVDLDLNGISAAEGDVVYLKLTPTGNRQNADKSKTTAGWGSDVRLWGGIVLTGVTGRNTEIPDGALYFEAFDEMDGGVDYLMGGQVNGTEKLGHLANAFGSDIADWTSDQADGLTGSYVAMRPGYVQIGHPDAITHYGSAYANHIGTLETPALNVIGDLKLSFKALVYRSPMYGREGTGKNANDVAGDVASVVVKINSGSFSATESVQEYTFENVSVSSWETKVLTIYGADADTKVTFTSPSDATGYTRWFLDDICITKR